VHQNFFPSQSGNNPIEKIEEKMEEEKKEPLQLHGFGEAHLLRDCPHRNIGSNIIYNVQDSTTAIDS